MYQNWCIQNLRHQNQWFMTLRMNFQTPGWELHRDKDLINN